MMQESEKLFNWLKSIKSDEYYTLFQNAAYDLQTISRMTPEDLTAIGITKPEQRRRLKSEISRLNIEDGIPNYWPSSLDEWLELIRLTDYVKKLKEQGYTTLEKILDLDVEDLEEIGIKKLGHQKRIMIAIKKLQSLAKGSSSSNTNGSNALTSGQLNHYSSASSLQSSVNLNSSLNSLNSTHSNTSKSSSLLHNNLYLPLQSQPIYQTFQEVAINTNRCSVKGVSPDGQSNNVSVNSSASIAGLITTNGTPTTELKTFQQLTSTTTTANSTSTTVNSNAIDQQLTNGSISSSSNSLASSLNNSSNSAMNLPPLLNGQYGYINNVNSYHHLINSQHPAQIVNSQLINGQLINGQLIHNNMSNGQLNQINQMSHPQLMMINRGRSMESLPQMEPVYGVRQLANGQLVNGQTAIVDGHQVQVIYANNQQQHPNEMYLIYNNDMDGTATLNRPKNLIKNRPVAKIAAKTRDLLTDTNGLISDNISEQKQALLTNQQIYGNLPLNNNYNIPSNPSNMNTVIANNMINTNLNNQYGQYLESTIYENNAYIQQEQQKLMNGIGDRNSYIYATLKRGKKIPPPIPKRQNSIRTNGQQQNQQPLTAPSTPSAHLPSGMRRGNSLDDAQTLLTHQLNQLALAQKLKQQLNNQRSSCSSLEVMQEEAFATCVKSLTSRFSMDSSSLDDDPPCANNSTADKTTNSDAKTSVAKTSVEKNESNSTDCNQMTTNQSVEEKNSPSADDHPLNQSTGSADFPPPPSPSVLLDNDASISENNSLNRPVSTPTPPLPSPPILETTQTSSPVKSVTHFLNNNNKTLGPQQQQTRPQYKTNNQIFKFDQPFECTVSSSSSTESMPFANDSVGTIMRPKPNSCAPAQLKQFASSSSSSSISSSASITSSSTSSSLSSISSNVNTLQSNVINNGSPNAQPLNQLANHLIDNVQQSNNLIQPQVHQSAYQSLAQTNQQTQISTMSNQTSAGNKIEHAVRSSVNCISNLSNHLNLSKLITSSNSATNTAFRSLLGKPVQPPQLPARPIMTTNSAPAIKNWPCSPVKQLTSPEHVPNINHKQPIVPSQPAVTIGEQATNEVNNGEKTIVNHDNFRSQQADLQSSPLTNDNGSKFQLTERTVNDLMSERNKYAFDYSNQERTDSSSANTNGVDGLDDIETMLANLSTQLDAMLTQAF